MTTSHATHLVTGATGFVGAALVLELLATTDDRILCLVRGGDDATATTRLHDALSHAAEVYENPELLVAITERTSAVAGDVTEPGCGGLDIARLPKIDEVWHSAASLKFEDRHAEEIHLMNVTGTANMIELTRALGDPVLNYISTAYVAGRRTGVALEAVPTDTAVANNVYEHTKILAEQSIEASGLRWRILRPSIVIGHSRTMAVTSFSGMYGFVSALLLFRRGVERQLGLMLRHRRVPVIAEPEIELNLVPVDFVARNAVRISVAGGEVRRVYHLTNAAAPKAGETMRPIFDLCALRPPVFVTDYGQLTAVDRKLDDGLDFYSSYLANGKTFDRTHTDALCGGAEASSFPMDEALVREFVAWYLDRIRQDGRATSPGAQFFAYRKGDRMAGAVS